MPDSRIAPNLWWAVTGTEPTRSVVQRPVPITQEGGPFAEGQLGLTILPDRIDWLYEPPEAAIMLADLPTLGPHPEAIEPFLASILRWSGSAEFPQAQRLAFGLVLVEPTPDRETGYQGLRRFIDAVPQGEASDFMYQINRPRESESGIPNLRINRLSKWSVALFRSLIINVAAGGTSVLGTPQTFLNLELDINTVPEFPGPLPRDRVIPIIRELVAAAHEVSVHGDRLQAVRQ